MNKDRKEKDIVNTDQFDDMYRKILRSIKHGSSRKKYSGKEIIVDYSKVDEFFDLHFGLKSLNQVATQAAKLYSISYISNSIARDYLRDNKDLLTRFNKTSGPFYRWQFSERDEQLETIYSYAKRRGVVKPLSSYLERGDSLIKEVKRRIQADLKDLCIGIKKHHDEIPSMDVTKPLRCWDAQITYGKLIEEYEPQHTDYVASFKTKEKKINR